MTKTMKPATAIGGQKRTSPLCAEGNRTASFYLQNAPKSTVLWTTSGKVAGRFNPAVLTFSKRCRSEHILRKPPAIAFDIGVVAELNRLGCQTLRVELEDGSVLTAAFQTLLEHGFSINRGCGRQLALPLRYWARHNPEQTTLPFWEASDGRQPPGFAQ